MQHALTRENTVINYFVRVVINFEIGFLIVNTATRSFITSICCMLCCYHFSSFYWILSMERIKIIFVASKYIKKSFFILMIWFFSIPWINRDYCFHSNWFIYFSRFVKIKSYGWNIAKFSVLRHSSFLFVITSVFEFW